jgi:hypothetical protein
MVSRSIDLSGQWLIFLPFLSGFAACRFSVFVVRWLFSLFFALQLLRLFVSFAVLLWYSLCLVA